MSHLAAEFKIFMKIKIYNIEAEESGTVELPDAVFGLKWNETLVSQVVDSQMANQRAPIAHAKMRGEVRGGGKKPWRQKGTGRARHGSIRSPIWKGGGVTHGPRHERNYKKKINKKMARLALFTALSAKAKDQEVVVVDNFQFSEAKTKHAAAFFKKMSAHKLFSNITKRNGVLVAFPSDAGEASRVVRNLPFARVEAAKDLSAREVLSHKFILFPKVALDTFAKQEVRK